jgi:acyl-CoA reductase-like NAD-dependent aldehyde dehydrogenase
MKILSKNPATGALLKELPATEIASLPELFARARFAQKAWAKLSSKERAARIKPVSEMLLNQSEQIIELIHNENGKPKFEAMATELLPALEIVKFFTQKGPRAIADQAIPLRLMKHKKSTLNYWPLGTVVVISPWNYPLLLPWGEIIMALVAGNAVVFKPSEVTPQIGLKIQDLFDHIGLPEGLLTTVIGDGQLGAALIDQNPDKVFFTGSVATGKKIAARAGERLIPVCLELGGKDPMIVLPDADLDFASSAALWGGYHNSGQACASVERILVHDSQADAFKKLLVEKMQKLRVGDEIGVTTLDRQKIVYDEQIKDARARGLTFEQGGEFSQDRTRLSPTLLSGEGIETSTVYNEETFGPVVPLTTYKNVEEAIRKANDNEYGLTASVITRDHAWGERVARELEVGTVLINEVTYTAGVPETPWGGVKHSGIGRKHSELGMLEFVHMRHIHRPRSRFFVFKSWWWFPYTPFQYSLFKEFLGVYRTSILDRLRAIPMVLFNLIQMLKDEKRL